MRLVLQSRAGGPVRVHPGALLLACVASVASPPVGAVVLTTYVSVTEGITLRVGSAGGTIDEVSFNVSNANVAPSPGVIAGAGAGAIAVTVSADKNSLFGPTVATLTASSSAGLPCITPASCGSTVIPFSSISWVSANLDTGTNAGNDIQNGSFDGSASQQLAQFALPGLLQTLFLGSSRTQMSNTLSFSYANSTLYPAGSYRGRVTFTATMN
ncbi:hypothetical protein [uncultured Pseudacidovorax sp.]|uniref:hypothetical protein n=1 Tax=uncultured Pseudacidovorax sp. TaxID=679313 RepID=UPI0025EDA880|nr:hypothetical protein [uncultured Pseudacidovorax sp.]